MFEMKDEYKLGVDAIDEQHQKLFEIAEQVYQTLKNEFTPDKYDNIIHILKELKEYTKTHFKDEEDYMKEIGYKKFFSQKIDHDDFINKLENIDLDAIDENQDEYLMNLLEFLNNWLVSHIVEKDLDIVKK
jgi:hemerythrin